MGMNKNANTLKLVYIVIGSLFNEKMQDILWVVEIISLLSRANLNCHKLAFKLSGFISLVQLLDFVMKEN